MAAFDSLPLAGLFGEQKIIFVFRAVFRVNFSQYVHLHVDQKYK